MNILEYNEYLYGTAPAEKCQNALEHHGVKGQEWDKRRYQNLDGSLTPLGRLHYGVGAPREEREAAEEAERRRQEEIDYNRSKSIREMDDDELQAAVARSRMETQFEQNMQNRAVNFMQSQVTEEQLKQQYDDLMYQRSRQKAERFMERVERLARFGGNLASAYGKVVDVKGKIEDVRAKRNLADQEQWKAEQQRTKFEEGEWNFGKKKSEYNMSLQNKLNSLKSDLDEMSGNNKQKSKKEIKAEEKAAKKAEKEAKKSGSDSDDKPSFSSGQEWSRRKYQNEDGSLTEAGRKKYLKQKGYSSEEIDSMTRGTKKSGIMSKIFGKKDKEASQKREALKEQTRREIQEAANERLGRYNAEHRSEANNSDRGYDWQSGMVGQYKKQKSDKAWGSVSSQAKDERNMDNSIYKSMAPTTNSKYNWSEAMATSSYYNGGKNVSKAALDRAKKRRKGSWR